MSRGVRQYVGIDRRITGQMQPNPGIELVAGTALALPFDEGHFDAVCLFDVIEHLPRGAEMGALREAHRVLCAGGKLYFSTPHASPVHTLLDPAWYFGHRHYRRSTIRRLLKDAGFAIDRLFVRGGLVEALDYLRFLIYKHALKRESPAIDFVNRQIARSHASDHTFGLSVFAVAVRQPWPAGSALDEP
jgi:SAM-dependent methyltransferase